MEQRDESVIVQYFQRLSNLYYLMIGLPLLVFGWVYLNLERLEPLAFFEHPLYRWWWHIPMLLIISAILVRAVVHYRKQLKKVLAAEKVTSREPALEDRVKAYYAISLPLYLLLMSTTLLTILSLYLSGHGFYAAAYGVLLLVLSLYRPSHEHLSRIFKLNKEEQKVLKEELKPLR